MSQVVIYEGPGAATMESDERLAYMQTCVESGVSVELQSESSFTATANNVCVIGHFENQEALVEHSGIKLFNLKELEQDAVLASIAEKKDERKPWKPWFPVIDFDRCTNCMQCLSFCLFNVYGVEDETIKVVNPENCKTDCPACSRVCPEVAIMFPKYKAGPINGAEVNEESLSREKMKVDISSLLGGDIYSALRNRSEESRSRFSKERDEERALKERQRCYKKLKEALDIPDTVLASLPDADMIEGKLSAVRNESNDQEAAES